VAYAEKLEMEASKAELLREAEEIIKNTEQSTDYYEQA